MYYIRAQAVLLYAQSKILNDQHFDTEDSFDNLSVVYWDT